MGSNPLTPVINTDELMSRVDNDMELLSDLIDLFLEDLDERLAGIQETYDLDDLDLMHERSHALKGSVSNFAAPAALAAAKQVDDLARTGIRDGLKDAIEQLGIEMDRIRTELCTIV